MSEKFGIKSVIDSYKNLPLSIPKASVEYIKVEYLTDIKEVFFKDSSSNHLQSTCLLPFGASPVIKANITGHQILAKEEDVKTVYEITVSLPQPFNYLPGDTIGILAINKKTEVDEVIECLGYNHNGDSEKPFHVQVTDPKKKLPIFLPAGQAMTIRRVLSECLDLHSVPKKLFIRALMPFTSDETEKRLLEVLCSKEGAKTYSEFIESQFGTFLGLIRLLKTCHPDFNILLSHLPRLLPRPYSISTSPCHANGKEIKFVFSFENGLVTTLLQEMIEGILPRKIDIYFRQSTKFCYSKEHFGQNLIMIGPGTGISPFISFLSFKEDMNVTSGDTWLITGCRYKNRNQLFTDALENFLKNGCLTKLSHAFSRDGHSENRYVQDSIRADKEEFVKWMMKPNTIVYVCGEGKKMLPDIQNTIVQCLADVNLTSESDSIEFVKELKKSGKYIEDVWI